MPRPAPWYYACYISDSPPYATALRRGESRSLLQQAALTRDATALRRGSSRSLLQESCRSGRKAVAARTH
jgi:hypothetical protein